MLITFSLISGCMLGFEFVFDDEENESYVVLDLFLFRVMFITEGK